MFSNPFRRLSQLKELLNTLDQHFADTKLSSALFEQNESISQFFVFTSVSSMQDDSLFNANDFSPKTQRVNFINIRKIMMFSFTANEAFSSDLIFRMFFASRSKQLHHEYTKIFFNCEEDALII